jgi:hypothetical protein
MKNQDNPREESLVPTGGSDLAPLAPANPLVSRGLADLTKVQEMAHSPRRSASVQELLNSIAAARDKARRHADSRALLQSQLQQYLQSQQAPPQNPPPSQLPPEVTPHEEAPDP